MIEGKETSLELKLKKISNFIEQAAYAIIIAVCLVRVIFRLVMSSFVDKTLFETQTLVYGAQIAIMAIVLLIVIIPEGLSLAAQIAMALSIGTLKEDKILVKNHDAIQKAATITDICVSKTGVLTRGNGQVKAYHLASTSEVHKNDVQGDFMSFDEDTKQTFIDCILMNNSASFQAEDPRKCPKKQKEYQFVYRPRGPAIEVAALDLLNGVDPDFDAREMLVNLRQNKREMFSFPFDQKLKRKTVVYQVSDESAWVVVKGAPESIAELTEADSEAFCEPL